jgi:hypothetical protein
VVSSHGVNAPDSVVTLAAGRLPPGTSHKMLPRLRFDRVARRVVRDLQALVGTTTGTLIVTITAPIRLPARTVATLGVRLRKPLARPIDEMVCGNRVRARFVRLRLKGGPGVIVFVHNPEPDPNGLLKLVETSLYSAQVKVTSARSRTK